jgi:methionine--tRNA ligase beta chain
VELGRYPPGGGKLRRHALRSACAGVPLWAGGIKMATIDDFRKLELRIAQIKEVNDHPHADKLLILTLDLGDRLKQVVAGIKNFYSKEELVGKQVVLVDNLDPVILRGVESQGMILAGSDENLLAVISPDKKLKLGSMVK